VPFTTLTRCRSCRASNRVPAAHLADTGRCGACKAPLSPAAEPIEADSASLQAIVQEAKVPILVDFWAFWCGPCRLATPEIEALAKDMAGRALILKVDIDKHPDLAARYHVQSIPNFAVFRNGSLFLQRSGVAARWELRRWLEQAGAR
jgi:thioredoxin 2